MRHYNLKNHKYGRLLVLDFVGLDKHHQAVWLCKCDCGKTKEVCGTLMRQGFVKSCGCLNDELRFKFGQLTKSKRLIFPTGKRFGRLTIIKEGGVNKQRLQLWECDCDCGKKVFVDSQGLRSGSTKSCGCLKSKDLLGRRFGRLVVIESSTKRKERNRLWKCKCDCGNTLFVRATCLLRGTKSCGCLATEKASQRCGSKSHWYNPNITDEERRTRRDLKNDDGWRNSVFKRDNYICKLCRIRGGRLSAHHLNGYQWAKEERLDVKNGVTLCEKCHRLFHKQYGKFNNTKQQFKIFLILNNGD